MVWQEMHRDSTRSRYTDHVSQHRITFSTTRCLPNTADYPTPAMTRTLPNTTRTPTPGHITRLAFYRFNPRKFGFGLDWMINVNDNAAARLVRGFLSILPTHNHTDLSLLEPPPRLSMISSSLTPSNPTMPAVTPHGAVSIQLIDIREMNAAMISWYSPTTHV